VSFNHSRTCHQFTIVSLVEWLSTKGYELQMTHIFTGL
jgi:hypothetical protein